MNLNRDPLPALRFSNGKFPLLEKEDLFEILLSSQTIDTAYEGVEKTAEQSSKSSYVFPLPISIQVPNRKSAPGAL